MPKAKANAAGSAGHADRGGISADMDEDGDGLGLDAPEDAEAWEAWSERQFRKTEEWLAGKG